MSLPRSLSIAFALLAGLLVCGPAQAAKLVEVRTLDEHHLMIHWLDGDIHYVDDGRGPTGMMGSEVGGDEKVIRYRPELDTGKAADPSSYTIGSKTDSHYHQPTHPSAAFRKTKVNGTNREWPEPKFTVEHTIFLRLPTRLENGQSYNLTIASGTNTDATTAPFTFDVHQSVSEAIHVNLIGYNPAHTVMKSADLYMWLGDGGARDYKSFEGRKVQLYNVKTKEMTDVGKVTFWKPRGKDVSGWDLTGSDVWNCDLSSFDKSGRYRLVIDGVGCSPDFDLSPNVYFEPFKTSVRGFFYMRLGMGPNFNPPPRQPRFIPDVDPPGFKVYRTTFGPSHPDWEKMHGDVWDLKDEWIRYREPGNPTNPDAWGGHTDALDWDRHPGHVSVIYDLLLPYYLTKGKVSDDDLGIAESGNGIPDLIDEARYEADFWLRLRDGKGGYSFGLNNPSPDYKTMHQACARPFMAWANAANCAMLADCLRIAGQKELMAKYRDAALEAYKAANGEDLDFSYNIGNGVARGRDYKMMAAAFLYNLTGDRAYEDAMAQESVVKGPESELDNPKVYCQYWGTAAYLMCSQNGWQPIHHPKLLANMTAAVWHEAMHKNVEPTKNRPSRRSTDENYGWFQSVEWCDPLLIAHALSTDPAEKQKYLRAMILEADYGLGRNPMNMVQMTGLGSRHVENIYTSGGDDGVPGMHPGHTPYMNANAWGPGYKADPQWYAKRGYPDWTKWPHGEALWNVRYCYSNGEFTPQQTMRGKTALLGYLYSLGKGETAR